MCEWSGQYELGDVKIFIFNKLEVLYSKKYGSIWVTFRVNERVKYFCIRTNQYHLKAISSFHLELTLSLEESNTRRFTFDLLIFY